MNKLFVVNYILNPYRKYFTKLIGLHTSMYFKDTHISIVLLNFNIL